MSEFLFGLLVGLVAGYIASERRVGRSREEARFLKRHNEKP